jgi:hypothetical protein
MIVYYCEIGLVNGWLQSKFTECGVRQDTLHDHLNRHLVWGEPCILDVFIIKHLEGRLNVSQSHCSTYAIAFVTCSLLF